MPTLTSRQSIALDQGDRRFLAILTAITALALIFGVYGYGLDFSAGKYLRNDGALGNPQPDPWAVYPFNDPTGFAHTVPGNGFVAERISSGELPVWDRMQGGGWSPVVAGASGTLHPFRWGLAWLPPHLATSGLLLVSASLALAGFVMLSRTMGVGLFGAIAVGIAWLLLPHSLAYAQMDFILILAFPPWILLAALCSRRNFDGPFCAQAMGLGLLAASGHPLVILVVGFGMALFLGLLATQARDFGIFFRFVLASAFGAALASAALLPFALGLTTEWNYKADTPYGQQFERWSWGDWLSLWSGVFRLDPGKANHDDMPALLRIPIFMALLVGVALVRGWGDRAVRAAALVTGVFLFLAVRGPWGVWLEKLPILVTIKSNYLLTVPLFYSCLLAALALRLPKNTSQRARNSIALASAALLVSSAMMLPRSPYWQPRPSVTLSTPEVLKSNEETPFRVVAGFGQVLLPNVANLAGFEDIRLVSPLQHRRYQLYVAISNSLYSDLHPVFSYPVRLDSPLLPMFNVRYAAGIDSPHRVYYSLIDPEREYRSFKPNVSIIERVPEDAKLVAQERGLTIVEYKEPRPRAYFVTDPVFSADLNQSGWAMLQIHRGERPARATIIEADHRLLAGVSFSPTKNEESVRVSYPGHRSVILNGTASSARLLVLNDTYADGWRARVNGIPAPILPVNLVARGVVVPPGAFRVEMRYTPPGMRAGAAIGLLALLGLFIGRRTAARGQV